MRQFVLSVLVLALSAIVWLHWGGLSNDMGTFIIMLADAFALFVIADNSPKKVKKG